MSPQRPAGMPLTRTVEAPDRIGIGMTGPMLGNGIGGAGGIRFGGWECACGKPMSKSAMRTAGSAGNGIADSAVESNCSTPVRAAKVAPTVCRSALRLTYRIDARTQCARLRAHGVCDLIDGAVAACSVPQLAFGLVEPDRWLEKQPDRRQPIACDRLSHRSCDSRRRMRWVGRRMTRFLATSHGPPGRRAR